MNQVSKARIKAKRQHAKQSSTAWLIHHKVPFTSFNEGTHLMIPFNTLMIHYYPSTGLFIYNGKRDRGIRNLLWLLGIKHDHH